MRGDPSTNGRSVLELVRSVLGGRPAWLVGGAVRDRVLSRPVADFDVVLEGDPGEVARALSRAARALGEPVASFPLSERFGAWRVLAREGDWQVDFEALRAETLEGDLALRDFTVNAIAEPLIGEQHLLDPLGGLEDLKAGRLRLAGERSLIDDPLRVLRLVRVAVELELEPDGEAIAAARQNAVGLAHVAPERIFAELQRIVACERVLHGLELLHELGIAPVVLSELEELRGVQQSHYHHRDVYGHTLEVLEQVIALQDDPAAVVGEAHAAGIDAFLCEPLSDGMTRGQALRWGALLHDAAKPATRVVRESDARVTFMDHDRLGAELARQLLARLHTSVRLREHVAGLVRHHLRLGFLVHEPQPLARAGVYDYLCACDPVEVDVTLLSVCDRLATRGSGSQQAIEAHMQLARRMLADALVWREHGPLTPLVDGGELIERLGLTPGPRVGELLAVLKRAQYAGEVSDAEQALELARAQLAIEKSD